MTDRELLELAAKEAGIPHTWDERAGAMLYQPAGKVASQWNPLLYDGDALRLAVKLRMKIEIHNDRIWALPELGLDSAIERCTENHDSATRRAIVRAAAAIGENLAQTK